MSAAGGHPDVERHGSGAPWEPIVGYSRVVRAGETVYVTGCTAIDEHGEVVGDTAYEQARQTLRNVLAALAKVGAQAEHVVRTRIYVTDISRWEEVGRAHGEVFGEVMPATTMVEVSGFIDPRMVVEIEAVAYLGSAGAPG